MDALIESNIFQDIDKVCKNAQINMLIKSYFKLKIVSEILLNLKIVYSQETLNILLDYLLGPSSMRNHSLLTLYIYIILKIPINIMSLTKILKMIIKNINSVICQFQIVKCLKVI